MCIFISIDDYKSWTMGVSNEETIVVNRAKVVKKVDDA